MASQSVGKGPLEGNFSTDSVNAATSFIQKESPFSKMKSIEHDPPISKNRVAKLAQYVSRAHNASKPTVSYPYVAYHQNGAAIPPYTTYISTKRNVLIEDDKHRTFLPYLGETFDVDIADAGEYVELETKIEKNQFNYHKMNRVMERASLHAQFVGDFLKDVGSTPEAVLEFLLDESGSGPPAELPKSLVSYWHKRIDYLEEEGYYEEQNDSDVTTRRKSSHIKKPEKQWKVLFEGLSDNTGHELAAGCLACFVFRQVAGFSLFHVVKQFQPQRELPSPRRGKADEDTISVREDYTIPDLHSLGTYAELVCQICKA